MAQLNPTTLVRSTRIAAVVLLGLSLCLSGCVYRMIVQQGNFLEARQVDQVQKGMTRSQVRFLLGTPMLPDAFDKDRWDYIYVLQMSKATKPEQQRLTVYFTEEKVSRIENFGAPSTPPAPASVAPASDRP